MAVSLHVAGERVSGCIGMRLYLPEEWTAARRRLRAAGVPREVHFERKWELALELLDEALGWGVQEKLVLADPAYGSCREFREALRARGLHFLVGVQGTTNV